MIAAAHFGAFTLGTEISYKVARAKGTSARFGEGDLNPTRHSIELNFDQYKLSDRFLGVLLADASESRLWRRDSTFDCILTDPPYGVREKGSKLGSKKRNPDYIYDQPKNHSESFPQKAKYTLSSTFTDLLNFAAKYLRIGGHVSFWFPIIRKSYSINVLPTHECLKLIHNCEQTLTMKCARRLLVYQKTAAYRPGVYAQIKDDYLENAEQFRNTFMSL